MIPDMTLDQFQKDAAAAVEEMQAKLMVALTRGLEAKLDEDLMLAIINREAGKLSQ